MRLRVSSEQIWTTKFHSPRSMAEISFRSPLAVLPLAVGGGGGGGVRNRACNLGTVRINSP
jgi:hypothetical protein